MEKQNVSQSLQRFHETMGGRGGGGDSLFFVLT